MTPLTLNSNASSELHGSSIKLRSHVSSKAWSIYIYTSCWSFSSGPLIIWMADYPPPSLGKKISSNGARRRSFRRFRLGPQFRIQTPQAAACILWPNVYSSPPLIHQSQQSPFAEACPYLTFGWADVRSAFSLPAWTRSEKFSPREELVCHFLNPNIEPLFFSLTVSLRLMVVLG